MPLLDPKIQQALREVGLGSGNTSQTIEDRLDAVGLSLQNSLEQLADIASAGDNSAVRLRAIEQAHKLRGILKDQAPAPPNITIVINDPELAGQVNPILLPRQLHKKEPVN